jgi:hypothetical protein
MATESAIPDRSSIIQSDSSFLNNYLFVGLRNIRHQVLGLRQMCRPRGCVQSNINLKAHDTQDSPVPVGTCTTYFFKKRKNPRVRPECETHTPMLEFRLLRGLPHVTCSKKHRSCEYSSETSLPRKILATNAPPGRSTCVVMLSAWSRGEAVSYGAM